MQLTLDQRASRLMNRDMIHVMRSRTVIIALALSLFGASIAAAGAGEPTGDLATLVEAHLRWLGGLEALTQLQDLTWTGTFNTAGFKGRTALRETRSGWSRAEDVGADRGRQAGRYRSRWRGSGRSDSSL